MALFNHHLEGVSLGLLREMAEKMLSKEMLSLFIRFIRGFFVEYSYKFS
jgi:hypothetical protein